MKKKYLQPMGYSAVELMLVLGVILGILYIVYSMSSSMMKLAAAQNAVAKSYNYAQAVVRYITTHQNLLRTQLSQNQASNGKIATVTPDVLINEGFIPNAAYVDNNLNQIPCTIIFYDKHQLQSFIYYRDNNDSKVLDQRQLKDGLNHIGAMVGLYQNGEIVGSAKDWALDNNFITKMFVAQGNVDLPQDGDSALYTCTGSQIAKNSYVVNVTTMLELENDLPIDDTIHQYSDVLHDVDESQSNNRMNSDLIMDYIPDNKPRTQSNIIFQNNPDCLIDPNNPDSMNDYSSDNLGGCKNRQLAIAAESANATSNQNIIITGFERGGVNTSKDLTKDNRRYVGAVAAASIQPTTQVAVGTPCTSDEISKMAQQKKSVNANDINNLYISQVICMKSITCPVEAKGYCYLPIQSVTINYTPNNPVAQCPVGMFISSLTTNVQSYDPYEPKCCPNSSIFGACAVYDSAHDHYWEGYQLYKDETLVGSYINGGNIDGAGAVPQPLYLPPAAAPSYLLPNRAVMGQVDYGYTCSAICNCPGYPVWAKQWQPVITAMTCTNDPSKATVLVQE